MILFQYRGKKLRKKYEYDLQKIINDNYEKIYKYCYWHMKDPYIAQDITQDVFMNFIIKCNEGNTVTNIDSYIYQSAKNRCLDVQKNMSSHWEEISENETDKKMLQKYETVLDKIVLDNAIMQLSDIEKEILLLRYSQEMKIVDIAKVLEMNRFKVQYRIMEALKKLKLILEREEYEF